MSEKDFCAFLIEKLEKKLKEEGSTLTSVKDKLDGYDLSLKTIYNIKRYIKGKEVNPPMSLSIQELARYVSVGFVIDYVVK